MDDDKVSIIEKLKYFLNISSLDGKIEVTPLTAREKRVIIKRICFIIPTLIIITLLCIWSVNLFNSFNRIILDNTIDIINRYSIYTSFYGSLMGAVLAGVATVITTYFIVHQSYKVDYHNERLNNLPIFELRRIRNNSEISEDEIEELITGLNHTALFEISNIGKGMAFNVSLTVVGDIFDEYFQIIKVNETKWLRLSCDEEEILIKFEFNDLYENLYTQIIPIDFSKDNIITKCTIPELVRKTRHIRYTQ